MNAETTADRLTLISRVHSLYFEPAIFVEAGETFWVEGRVLNIRAGSGIIRQHRARASRPDDVR